MNKKWLLREQFKQRRIAIAEEEYRASSVEACRYAAYYCTQLRGVLHRPLRIFAYFAFGRELNTMPLLMKCRHAGDKVYLPRTISMNRTMTLHLWDEQTRFSSGCFGLCEPEVDAEPLLPEKWWTLDIVIVPGIAFDRHGGRLGLGAGYYDRFWRIYLRSIEAKNTRIAFEPEIGGTGRKPPIARISCLYAWQIIDEVPMEPHDMTVDRLFTEQGVIICQ